MKTQRHPDQCPYRHASQGPGEKKSTCGFIGLLSGTDDPDLRIVSDEFCVSCCRHEIPSKDELNPIVASLLYDCTLKVIERGGVEGCDVAEAKSLQETAIANLTRISQSFEKSTPPDYGDACFHLGAMTQVKPCKTCSGSVRLKHFLCHHQDHDETTIRECQKCVDYEPGLTQGDVKNWAIGLTTAPRKKSTIARTIKSFCSAGWSADSIQVFAEPDSPIPDSLSGNLITTRATKLGAWPNWLLALTELTLREPHADAYLMVQDDAVFCKGLRTYLEKNLWPSNRLGVVSLHTASHFAREYVSGFFPATVGWGAWGAMGYVFPNAAARALMRDPLVVNHRNRGRGEGLCNVDSVVGEWCQRSGLDFYMHAPSLCQHIGFTSTLWKNNSLEGRRSASDFPGEETDIGELMP
jgi:hypothetical protein